MIQEINGVKMLMKVLERPTLNDVQSAILRDEPISLTVVSYSDCTERVGPFSISEIQDLRILSDGKFSFSGRVFDIEVVDVSADGFGCDTAIYERYGLATVLVDKVGAELQFIITLSLNLA